ncbi:MAG: 4'-phosphopantetheinyl transferase superfamily protein [Myxococcota bacterium]
MGSKAISVRGPGQLRAALPNLHLVVLDDRRNLPLERAQRLLDPVDRARALQIGNPDVRRQFVLGRFLLWRMVEAFGLPRVPLRVDPLGKPYLEGRPLDFNLSHTRGGIVVLLGTGELGVDVEPIGRRVDVDGVGARTFTHSELRWVRAGNRSERFIQMWTQKEAYMKARGMGFRLSPKSFSFDVSERGEVRLERSRDTLERGWVFHQEQVDGLRIALAARCPGSERGAKLSRYNGASLF